jgi:hypothetical protein
MRLTVSQSVSLGAEPHLGIMTNIYYSLAVTVLFFWGALSDERTGLSFVYAAGARPRSVSWVRVPWISRPYFIVSVLRLPFSSPPTTRRVTVEVFDPASTRVNCFYLCLHLLKRVFRQPSREHLVEGFGLSVVTKTTSPLCRKRLSMYALSRERVYNCHPDNDAYSALIVAVV